MKIVLILIFFLISLVSFSQGIQFYQEKLDFEITDSVFTVEGTYYFRNTTNDTIRQFMLYPFPENSELGEVISVKGNAVYPNKSLEVIKGFNQKAAHFRLVIFPKDSAITHIVYKQKITNQKAEYILTSTKAWNRPLEKADFSLKIPMDSRIDSLSYNADSLCCSKEYLMYKWQFEDFMPDRNFYVSFSKVE
jgi:hypothetical protein